MGKKWAAAASRVKVGCLFSLLFLLSARCQERRKERRKGKKLRLLFGSHSSPKETSSFFIPAKERKKNPVLPSSGKRKEKETRFSGLCRIFWVQFFPSCHFRLLHALEDKKSAQSCTKQPFYSGSENALKEQIGHPSFRRAVYIYPNGTLMLI